ncbi:MAG: hypothetical protein IPI53_15765 [Saprospiraceae bacterium]|nr:hypothetical protein [Saprospiraceae bacterium]
MKLKALSVKKPTVMIDLYLPLSIPGVDHPYKYVIFMPEIELEEYSPIEKSSEIITLPCDVIRDQLYNTVISLILKMSGDKMTRKQIDIMDISEFMGWIIGLRGESL